MQLRSLLALIPAVSAGAVPYANPVAFAEALALEHGATYAQTMGEIAVLYPPDRQWSEAAETIAPCGTYSSSGNRTDFPLDDGFVALVAKSHSAWSVNLKISYNTDPTSNDEFETWATGNVTNEIDIGHTCFYMPDQPSRINAGDYATIQLEYMAIEDDANLTHYACSDIVFVEESVFEATSNVMMCFNATDNDYYSYSIFADEETTAAATVTATVTASASSSGLAAAGVVAPSTLSVGAILLGLVSFFA